MSRDGFVTSFVNGRRCAYGKKFWRWAVSLRGGQSQHDFATKTLGFSPGTGGTAVSKGVNHGNIDLDQIIQVLVRLGRSVRRDLPELPGRPVLVMHGLVTAISQHEGNCPSVETLAFLLEIERKRELVEGTRIALKRCKTDVDLERLTSRASTLAAEIGDAAKRLLDLYHIELPGEMANDLSKAIRERERGFKYLDDLWETSKTRLDGWLLCLDKSDWSYPDETNPDSHE
jgi:hypothetical protein